MDSKKLIDSVLKRYDTSRPAMKLPFEGKVSDWMYQDQLAMDNNLQPLGEFVYTRTYARYIEELGRREKWIETVKRAVEYNTSLAPTYINEADDLFESIHNLEMFLSGRTLYIGGTESALKFPTANFNCSFTDLESLSDFSDIMYLLMVGSGAGIGIRQIGVYKFPKFSSITAVKHLDYKHNENRRENTQVKLDVKHTTMLISVGDSKEGWCQALLLYLLAMTGKFSTLNAIEIDYNQVRPKGTKLKKFGGTASGHESLRHMFKKIDNVILNAYAVDHTHVALSALDLLDIANIIGENVVSGGVRRTAEVILSDAFSEIETAKTNLYVNGSINKDIMHRQYSNNTTVYSEKPTRERLHWHLHEVRHSGEPGICNEEQALKRFSAFRGMNPCGEVLLDSKGLCNLTTINIFYCLLKTKHRNSLDWVKIKKVARLATRASMRLTMVDLELPEWDAKLKQHRQLGVSMTGWQDMVNSTGMDKETQVYVLRSIRRFIHEEAEIYAKELGIEVPKLMTTIKPEGTLSQLPVVSSGIHYNHSEYYIRRVRCTKDDAVAKTAIKLGWTVHPELGYTWDDCHTVVFEFPVKSPKGITKDEASAIQQLENYKMFMDNYVDHNVSITVHVREHEWDDVEQWLWDNWDSCVSLTFIGYSDNFFELLPYESITEEEYLKRVEGLVEFDYNLLGMFDSGQESELIDAECVGGLCPIR